MMNILPDPNNKMNAAGQLDPSGVAGPGFASVKLSSVEPVMKSMTNSGRTVLAGAAAQYWKISIGYNPMTREEFDVLHAFLMSKGGGLIPFYVSLPQYLAPQDPLLTTDISIPSAASAGDTSISFTAPPAGNPQRGDLFTVQDPTNTAHTKAYKVTSVDAGVIYFAPGFSKAVDATSTLIFQNPLIRVVLDSDSTDYTLNVNSLYSSSLNLKEAQV